MRKKRKARVQRIEQQLRQARAEIADLRDMVISQGKISVNHSVRIIQAEKKLNSNDRKLIATKIWLNAILSRPKPKSCWGKFCNWLAEKVGCH